MTRSNIRFTLALLVLAIGLAFVVGLFFLEVPEGNQRIMDLSAGIVLGWGTLALAFYFGTSESSAQKTELLAHRPTGEPDDPVHVEEDHQ